jgi:hypothetical protein
VRKINVGGPSSLTESVVREFTLHPDRLNQFSRATLEFWAMAASAAS